MLTNRNANTMLPGWATRLERLRSVGTHRDKPSASYAALRGKLSPGSRLLDVGCGNSRDRLIAASRGVVAYGVDLFAGNRSTAGFIQADGRRLPFVDQTFDAVVCQAVVALIPPDDRFGFYVEVARVLKPKGWLAISTYSLADGWRVKADEESQRILAADFDRVCSGLYRTGDS